MAPQRLKGARRETWEDGPIVDILSRLPAKSICSFKTVCKSWNRLTSYKDFVKKHFARSKENPSFISCPNMDTMKLYTINPGSLQRVSLRTMIPDERSHEECMYMISSFNGLICSVNLLNVEEVEDNLCDLQIWICNPCTGERLLLPQGTPSFWNLPSVGVAYASDTSDYRVFRIFCTGKKGPEERRTLHLFSNGREFLETEQRYTLAYECEEYSSFTGSWRKIGPVSCFPIGSPVRPFSCSHIFVGGKVYWLVSSGRADKILSVDLEGRIDYLKLPKDLESLNGFITECTYLINLQGSLSMVVLHLGFIKVWVPDSRKEDGWDVSFREECPIEDNELVFAVFSSENKIVCWTETHWRVFDVAARTWRGEEASASGYTYPTVLPFTESFLKCEGGEVLL